MPRASDAHTALDGRVVLLDCRWLGRGGAGRLTQVLLAELALSPPPGRWLLWGEPSRLSNQAFRGARVHASHTDPRAALGQREIRALPGRDVAVYMHQIRPLVPGPSVTFVHDTIPLRFGGPAPVRLAKRLFLLAVMSLSTRVLTGSEASRAAIARDLRVPPDRVDVVPYPVDPDWARGVADARARLPHRDTVLYVGRFAPHKNLRRLCAAFPQTRFARAGGRLVLLGGSAEECRSLGEWLERRGLGGIELRGACFESELVEALATSRALVLPSLEEGYGLPAFEAAAAGIPVAASRTGALTELPPSAAVLFEPTDVGAIARAIDAAVGLDPQPFSPPGADLAGAVVHAAAAALGEGAAS